MKTHQAHHSTQAIEASPEGLACYSSLCSLLDLFTREAAEGMDPLLRSEFIGMDLSPEDGCLEKQMSYTQGGIGHVLTLVCQAHTVYEEIKVDKDSQKQTLQYSHSVSSLK